MNDTPLSQSKEQPVTAHSRSAQDVAKSLDTDVLDGLRAQEAEHRLTLYGSNEIGSPPSVSVVKIIVRQVMNAMSMILILAMVVSFAVKAWIESGVIGIVIALNFIVGFVQEFKAERTMLSLRSLSALTASVVRDGQCESIPAVMVVPGDLVMLKMGDTVPADVRLIKAVNFETDEALLTGESVPVCKDSGVMLSDDAGPGDWINVGFSSSVVVKGHATAVVYATGMGTQIGSIAAALGKRGSRRRPVKRRVDGTAAFYQYIIAASLTTFDAIGRFVGVTVGTPLQRKLSKLALVLLATAVTFAIVVMAANKFANKREVVMYAVATGLSMLPASLVVILTITMAAGTRRMVARHVIVRNLSALEALGGVTDICSDKTGTLTQGRMVVQAAWVPSKGTYTVGLASSPFDPTEGTVSFSPDRPDAQDIDDSIGEKAVGESNPSTDQMLLDNSPLDTLVTAAAIANLARVHQHEGEWKAQGDPTEIALQVFSSRFNKNRAQLVGADGSGWADVAEFPFDSSVKMMSILARQDCTQKLQLFTKGAVERVLEGCIDAIWNESDNPEQTTKLTAEMQKEIISNANALSSKGLRVLAFATRAWQDDQPDAHEKEPDRATEVEVDLTFCGLVGIYDPPRLESARSVAACRQAGIVVHMLTGDHPSTAREIACQVGILDRARHANVDNGTVMTATQFDGLSDSQVDALVDLPLVVARCTPTTKVRMIDALHRRRRFVAMTGDGVNDSPALQQADVGIAMGISGSDVAKEASDLILTDDNFASIVNAIEEGRRMFDNIQRFILHLLALNIAQTVIMLVGLAFKDQAGMSVFPVSPVEALWIIMITSGLPDMGLGFERAVPEIMKRPPHNLHQGVFTPEVLIDIFAFGFPAGVLGLVTFIIVVYGFGNGNLGINCNNSYGDDGIGVPICQTVFRARSTVFSSLTFDAFLLAWQMIDMRRSFFLANPASPHRWTQWARDIWQNQFLFWAIVGGCVILFPTIYIPVINTKVFRHAPISWEWGIVAIQTVVFMAMTEFWLWIKRAIIRRRAAKNGLADPFVVHPDELDGSSKENEKQVV